jgi:hypothetical protein
VSSATGRVLCALTISVLLQVPTAPAWYVPRAASHPLDAGSSLPALTAAEARRLSTPANDRVIVVLRNQHAEAGAAAPGASWSATRAAILHELGQVGAKALHPFQVINAMGATISASEAARLRTNPDVLAVMPDRVIQLARPVRSQDLQGLSHTHAGAPRGGTVLSPRSIVPACTTSKVPSLEPQALQLTNTAAINSRVPQARRLRSGTGAPITGRGVKVAYIADGIDIYNPDFIRNGKSVFVDYKDFSGDGPTAPTAGGEAFLDASSIAAQGRHVYDVNSYLVNPLPKRCPIRILGMAPGANLIGLKVFGKTNATTTAAFIQAIDYAVNVDHVNVLNESFGSNLFPDFRNDPISIANANAVDAGVTVTVASGDAGVASTIGTPGSDPGVITVGATTQFRAYTQVNGSGINLGNGGYVDNNVAALSSAGFTQLGPRTVDVVAPGDLGWALCTPSGAHPPAYSDCTNVAQTAPSRIQLTGGTSESAPLVAGEAALVIQAYRSTHSGTNPSPLEVKQLITSTAKDLGILPKEQGAGLIDSYRAVQAALSYRDAVANPKPRADRMLISDTTAFTATDAPNTPEPFAFKISNMGSRPQRLAPQLRTLGQTVFHSANTLYLDPLSDTNTFIDQVGAKRAYMQQDIRVPAKVQRLNAAIAWHALQQPSSVVRLDLFDPAGRFAAFSDPQSAPGMSSGFGQVSVRNPVPGVWKAVIWTRATATAGSYFGAVRLSVNGSRFKATGAVTPAALLLQPRQSATFTVNTRTPLRPGDRDEEVVFPATSGTGTLLGAIPITLRALIPLGAKGGRFSGTLTGGNGRTGAPGQTLNYQFDVPPGQHDLDLSLRIADPGSNLEGVLIDPFGQPIDVQTMAGAISSAGLPSYYTGAMQFFRRDPQAGRWLFVLLINNTIEGATTAQRFLGTIAFNGVRARTAGIPSSGRVSLPAGKPVTAAVSVANSGVTSKDFFLDPRLATTGLVPLQAPHSYSVTLPITNTQMLSPFIVPPAVTTLAITAHAPTPVSFDAFTMSGAPPFGGTGSPDVYKSSAPQFQPVAGDFMAPITVQAPEVAPGPWQTMPEQLGPFGTTGAAPSTVDIGATAFGEPFDRQVATTTGDIWSPFSTQYQPLTLSPGQVGTIGVQIIPRGPPGTLVSGFLYLDTFNPNSSSGDELAAIPYAYTIGKKRSK